jgi:outer membrane lipoprotein-sorting protein
MRRKRRRATTTDGPSIARRGGSGPRRATAAVLAALAAVSLSAHGVGAETAGTPSELAEARALVATVLDRYAKADAYRLAFTQESYWSLADSLQTVEGTLFVDRPADLSNRHADSGRIVARGETVRVYVPATAQFFIGRLDSTDVLVDPARLLDQYEPDPRDPLAPPVAALGLPAGSRTVRLIAGPSITEPASLEVSIDPASHEILALTARSRSGDWTTYRIRSSQWHAVPSDDEFHLVRPPGTELITSSPFGVE